MAIDWIIPVGKNQTDIDKEKSEKLREEEKRQARTFLEDTDYRILKAIESILTKNEIERALITERQAARNKINE